MSRYVLATKGVINVVNKVRKALSAIKGGGLLAYLGGRPVLGLLISEIIQRDHLQVDPERVRQTIENLAQSYEKPEEVVQWYYSNQEMLAGIQTLVMEDTVVEWISGKAKVEDTSMSFDELMQS